MMMLSLESLTVGYGHRTVLRDVTLDVARGEVVALIGPNGAGKSTLIRAASAVLRPAAGRVIAAGEDVHRLGADRRAKLVAVVPQAASLPDAFTAADTVLMGRTAHVGWLGRESDADRNAAEEAMRRTSTSTLASRRIEDLSGGERQLVLIARALAQCAPVLLMDEPTAHLDLRHQEAILKLARSLARSEGLAILIALHDVNLAARHADRVALLAGGGLRAVGAPPDVLTGALLEEAYRIPVRVVKDGAGPIIVPDPGA